MVKSRICDGKVDPAVAGGSDLVPLGIGDLGKHTTSLNFGALFVFIIFGA
jgi:hypothetical protein